MVWTYSEIIINIIYKYKSIAINIFLLQLAAKLSGTPLSPAGLEFAVSDEDSDVVPKPDEELDGVQCDEGGAKGDDILGNEGDGEHADGGDGAPADGGDDASQSQGVFVRGLNRYLFF